MRSFLTFLVFLFPFLCCTQTVDSTIINQVDSLIQISRSLTGQQDFDQALKVNAEAEKLALEKLGEESASYGSCCFNHGRVLRNKGAYPEAEKWYLQSKAIREKALGKEHPDYGWCLNDLGNLYMAMGEYEKSETFYLKAKAIWEKALGKEDFHYGGVLNNLASLYIYMSQYEKSETLFIEARDIREKALGKEHPDYARSLNNLAMLYMNMSQYEKSETLYIEARDIYEKALGKEHPDYAWSLNNLALLYMYMSQYEKSEALYIEASAILENALGKEHPDYAYSLQRLADYYLKMGQYKKSELLVLEFKAILEKGMGKEHPNYANCLYRLAVLHDIMGQFEKSEPLYLEAIAIQEKVLGKDNHNYAIILDGLALLYSRMGQYEKSEPLHIEALAIQEKLFGKEHIGYASSLENLGALFYKMGQFEKFESLTLNALAVHEKVQGKEHLACAVPLVNLAILYYDRGEYEKSETFYTEAKTIFEKVLGKENPDYATSLKNLAILYKAMGKYEKSELLSLEAKTIFEKVLGKEHHEYAAILNNLAILYKAMGEYEKSELLFLEAEVILEKALGKEHPNYASWSLTNLARLYKAMGEYEKSEPYFLELSTVNQTLLVKSLLHLSEEELNNYLNTFSGVRDQILSFNQGFNSEKLTAACFDNSLFYKGFLLNASNQLKSLANSSPAATETFVQLKGYKRRLATQYSLPVSDRDSNMVISLEEKASQLEKELARSVAGYNEARRQVNWQNVRASLKTGEAAVEFVHYQYHGQKEMTDSTMYAALIVKPGDAVPTFIPLFEEKSLDSLLLPFGQRKADYVNHLYTLADRGAKALDRPQKTLYQLLWQPMEKTLEGIETIYFAPSGLLHRLNIGAIPTGEESILANQYTLVALGSTRQLVIPSSVETTSKSALLFGGIEYEADTTAIAAANADIPTDLLASRGSHSISATDPADRGGTWNYLKWTEKEISSIEPLLQEAGFEISTRNKFSATEESFKSIGQIGDSPRILHIATHGYFFPDPDRPEIKEQALGEEQAFKMSEHPMIRSGLLLAGSNHAWKTGKAIKPEMEDGILTAYEISQMNLSNTELVVLSACETGLGDIKGNEGVYGLQRAFKIAGAKYLVMSLWQVPDKETAYFMEIFYRNMTEEQLSIPDAFGATQKELRENPFITPYQWAGFVLVE